MPTPLRILFAGSGEFGRPTLEALAGRHQIVHVYTQPDRPAGRGRKLAPTAIAAVAEERGLPVTRTADLNATPLPPADVLVVIAFGQRISEAVTRRPRLGAVNLHASLLPKHRGAAPIHHALMRGERIVGNSIIRLARRMDAGAILGQSRLEVRPAETTGELHDRLAEDGAVLMLTVLEELAAGTAVPLEQDHAVATLAPKLSRVDARVDFSRPSGEVAARINGLSPWPGCHVRLMDGERTLDEITLLRARPAAGAHEGTPGVLNDRGEVICGGGTAMEVLELQSRGRRRVALSDYRNGHRWEAGLRVEGVK